MYKYECGVCSAYITSDKPMFFCNKCKGPLATISPLYYRPGTKFLELPESKTPHEKIVSMIEFQGRIFLATESGVFVKDENDKFTQLVINYSAEGIGMGKDI